MVWCAREVQDFPSSPAMYCHPHYGWIHWDTNTASWHSVTNLQISKPQAQVDVQPDAAQLQALVAQFQAAAAQLQAALQHAGVQPPVPNPPQPGVEPQVPVPPQAAVLPPIHALQVVAELPAAAPGRGIRPITLQIAEVQIRGFGRRRNLPPEDVP